MAMKGFPKREFKHEVAEGVAVCKKCNAVHMNKRWFYDNKKYALLAADKGVFKTICLGCQMVDQKHVDGLFTLHSPKIKTDKNQVINLIKNEAEKEIQKNPTSRIVAMEHKGEDLIIYTTTQFLAMTLGHAVKRAYKGKLEIQKLQREKFVRVKWQG